MHKQSITHFVSFSVRETDSNTLLPLECQYLNRNALTQLVGMQAPLVKHFALKRKPKSAALRAELLQKCELLKLMITGWVAKASEG